MTYLLLWDKGNKEKNWSPSEMLKVFLTIVNELGLMTLELSNWKWERMWGRVKQVAPSYGHSGSWVEDGKNNLITFMPNMHHFMNFSSWYYYSFYLCFSLLLKFDLYFTLRSYINPIPLDWLLPFLGLRPLHPCALFCTLSACDDQFPESLV